MNRYFQHRNGPGPAAHLAIASDGLQKDRMRSRTIQIATFVRVILNVSAIRRSTKRFGYLTCLLRFEDSF